jgi:hypothetical protein
LQCSIRFAQEAGNQTKITNPMYADRATRRNCNAMTPMAAKLPPHAAPQLRNTIIS